MKLGLLLTILLVPMALTAGCPSPPGPTLPLVVTDNPAAESDFADADEAERSGATTDAKAAYLRFLETHPTDPLAAVAKIRLGRILLAEGAIDDAAGLFQEVTDHEDASLAEGARFYLAVCDHLRGQHQQAVDTLTRLQGQTIDPEDTALLYLTLAASHTHLGQRREAVAAYDRLIAESAPETDKATARQEMGRLIREATPEELETMRSSLPRSGEAWRSVSTRALRAAYERADLAAVRDIAEELESAGVELEADLRAMTQRAERTDRVDPYAIGAILPLSGRGQEVGQMALWGMMLAAGLPHEGPAAADSPRVYFRDSGGDAERARTAVSDLVTLHQVAGIVGPPSGAVARAAAERAGELGVPFIALAPNGTATATNPFVFRYFPTLEEEVAALVQRAMAGGATRFAVLHPNQGFGQRAARALRQAVQAQGGTVVSEVAYERGTTSFRDPATTLAGVEFDALLLPDAAARIALVAPALAAVGLWSSADDSAPSRARGARGIRLLLPSVAYAPRAQRSVDRYLDHALVARGFDAAFGDASQAFAEAFQAQHGRAPGAFAAASHDALRLLLEAAQRGMVDGEVERDAIRRLLPSVELPEPVGASGGLDNARTPRTPVRVGEVQGGTLQFEPETLPAS